jgi:hypothetical protein
MTRHKTAAIRSLAAISTRSGNGPALTDVLLKMHIPRKNAASRRFSDKSTALSRYFGILIQLSAKPPVRQSSIFAEVQAWHFSGMA